VQMALPTQEGDGHHVNATDGKMITLCNICKRSKCCKHKTKLAETLCKWEMRLETR
jgi:hypothetical protein